MLQCSAAVATAMVQRSCFEERGHGAFAFRTLHVLYITVDNISGTTLGAGTGRGGLADPDGLALVAHDGFFAGSTGGGLTGRQGNRDQCEGRDLEELKDAMFVCPGWRSLFVFC